MFKFGTIGMFQRAKNNPRVQCNSNLKIGYAFTIDNNGSHYTEEAIAFADAATAKLGDVWVCYNIIDKPELQNTTDYVVTAGEYIRAFKLDDLMGYPVELSTDLCSTALASVAVGDILVPEATSFKWVKEATADYKVGLEVLKKTVYNGKDTGYLCKVIKQA